MNSELRMELGRLMWIGFEGTALEGELRRRLSRGEAGGVVLFRRNLPSSAEGTDLSALRALCDELHAEGANSGAPLFLSVDQEGGRVQRIREPAARWPPMYSVGESDDPEKTAREWGQAMGQDLRTWGFDVDFAPVLDVHTNPENPIIGDRAFSDDPERAAARALAFAEGLRRAGIISCGKHFPGHGDTCTDSHLALPRLDHDLQRLRAVELHPFAAAVQRDLPMIMTAHVVFSALDPSLPATLSEKVVGGLLRREMGYEGVVVSDDLDMKAIADHYGVGDAAVAAVVAGCDVLLLCRDREHQEHAREALIREAEKSRAFRARVAESAARLRALARAHFSRAA